MDHHCPWYVLLSHREGGGGEGEEGGKSKERGREKGRRGREGRGVQTGPITVVYVGRVCSKWTITVRGT